MILAGVLIAIFAGGLYWISIKNAGVGRKEKDAESRATKILKDAERNAEDVRREALIQGKEEIHRLRNELEDEMRERRDKQLLIESRVLQREEHLDQREAHFEVREGELTQKKTALDRQQADLDIVYKQQVEILEKVAGLSQEEAKKLLLENLERDLKYEASKMIKETEDMATKTAQRKAREIIATAIQRCASDNVVELTTSVVTLPSDEMKGRLIGREGRNIRAFETMTGIDLIIDDTPEAVILSGFDPIRREIARQTLRKLVADGRIHPTRIEEVYEQCKKELEANIVEIGERTAMELDIQDISPQILYLLGRLHYRTSYGQNQLSHSVEVAHVASLMAQELGVNPRLACRAGLLHDIGKAIDFEREGTHAGLGAAFAHKHGENDEVVHAILAHHEEQKPQTIEAILVAAADAVSASRPGARRESVEAYVKRLENLELLAVSFQGVEKAFAIQSGREVRVMVKPDIINDKLSAKLAHDIVRKIESELEYPGTIKVTVIRETRVTDVAK